MRKPLDDGIVTAAEEMLRRHTKIKQVSRDLIHPTYTDKAPFLAAVFESGKIDILVSRCETNHSTEMQAPIVGKRAADDCEALVMVCHLPVFAFAVTKDGAQLLTFPEQFGQPVKHHITRASGGTSDFMMRFFAQPTDPPLGDQSLLHMARWMLLLRKITDQRKHGDVVFGWGDMARLIATDLGNPSDLLPVSQLTPQHIIDFVRFTGDPTEHWETMRLKATRTDMSCEIFDAQPEKAKWMDAGCFARYVILQVDNFVTQCLIKTVFDARFTSDCVAQLTSLFQLCFPALPEEEVNI